MNVEGVNCGPKSPEAPFNVLVLRWFSKTLLDDAVREGCVRGIGEGALDDKEDDPSVRETLVRAVPAAAES